MTVELLYKQLVTALTDGSVENADFECDCLFDNIAHFSRIERLLHPECEIMSEFEEALKQAVNRRIKGEPLQYIIGMWQFMGFDFIVGNGVLIPRPETEILVETADAFIKKNNSHIIYDLCSGSGAIGLSIAKLNSNCEVFLFEKFDAAIGYLRKNLESLNVHNAHIIKCDVLNFDVSSLPSADVILSNPPYIKNREIPLLQKEVQFEPSTALDGGEDGLIFYRCIAERWLDKLQDKGMLMVECGDEQSADIVPLFSQNRGITSVIYDYNNIDRFVQLIV